MASGDDEFMRLIVWRLSRLARMARAEVKNQQIFHFNACERWVSISEYMGTESSVFSAGCAVIDDAFCLFAHPLIYSHLSQYIVRERVSQPPTPPLPRTQFNFSSMLT